LTAREGELTGGLKFLRNGEFGFIKLLGSIAGSPARSAISFSRSEQNAFSEKALLVLPSDLLAEMDILP